MIGGLRFFSMDSKVTKGETEKEIESLSDFAVLTRTKAQFDTIIKAFNDHSIPYQVIGTKSFLSETSFSQIITILKHFVYPENEFFAEVFENITKGKFKFFEKQTLKENIQELWNGFFEKEFKNKKENMEAFLKMSENIELKDFINQIEQKSGQDDYNPHIEAVSLMTIHASKGLEFKCVFVPGVEDGILPYTIFREDADIDEERRLLYVAMTRAKKFLYLSFAKSRNLNNLQHNLKRSRFIDDIKKELLQFKKQNLKPKSKDTQLDLFGN